MTARVSTAEIAATSATTAASRTPSARACSVLRRLHSTCTTTSALLVAQTAHQIRIKVSSRYTSPSASARRRTISVRYTPGMTIRTKGSIESSSIHRTDRGSVAPTDA